MYIIQFKTAYPFGLNDRVNNISVNAVKNQLCIYENFFNNDNFVTPRANRVRSKSKHNTYINFDEFLEEINSNSLNDGDLVKYIKSKIFSLKKSKAKFLIKSIHKHKFKYNLVKDLIIDLLKFKTGCNRLENTVKFDSYLVLNFSHKFFDLINIPQILYDKQLIDTFPIKYTYPKISFKYSRTLGSYVYNYSLFSKNIVSDNIDEYP